MRRTILASALISFLCVYASSAWAWWDAGHMQIAYVAYKHLDASVKGGVDALLKLNPDYSKWAAGARDEKKPNSTLSCMPRRGLITSRGRISRTSP